MSRAFHLAVGEDGLATVTFDAPDRKVNVFTSEVMQELQELVLDLGERHDIGCLVLLSGKPGNFIAGADVDGIASVTDPIEAETASRHGQRIFREWEELPFPTVAAVRGTCVGGGTELALASTYIVVSDRESIRIGLPEIKLGILPAWGGCTRMPERIDLTDALDLILAGKLVPPKKAFKIGLADALLPDPAFPHLVRE
ncbi:MAG: enoyl-CoA hydratase-related protein, partial [Thermoanaerobaculia bacterium]|nr:enoyl-CoA hydratase-related protein [Thermoanaerobaculia bacterium]